MKQYMYCIYGAGNDKVYAVKQGFLAAVNDFVN